MADDTFDIDAAELPDDVKPKPTEKTADAAPRKRGRPPGSGTTAGVGPKLGSPQWVKSQCQTLVASVNTAAALIPLTARDALDEQEMSALSDALTVEAMSSKRIQTWLTKAGVISPHVLLVQTLLIIAAPRLRRHGIIGVPEEAGPDVGRQTRPDVRPAPQPPSPEEPSYTPPVVAFPLAAGGAYIDNGYNGLG